MKRRTQRPTATALIAMGLAAGCQLIGGIDSRSVGSQGDAAGDVGVDASADGDAMASNVDAGDAVSQTDGGGKDSGDATTDAGVAGDATAEAGDAGDASAEAAPGCPTGGGPAMIDAAGICIDSTEVTVGQYAAFLAAVDAGAQVPVSPACPSGASFVPGGDWPQSPDSLPVDHVVWCQAWSFCKWAGKRLCGAIGGGPITSATTNGADPGISQWFAACSQAGSQVYPYGSTYQPSSCNGAATSVTDAGSLPTCAGGYPGIFDMSGNVSEWEDNCDDGGANANCYLRGGSYEATGVGHAEWLKCGIMTSYVPRSSQPYSDVGFRCCGP
jgi:sulfatase modifying factor 1